MDQQFCLYFLIYIRKEVQNGFYHIFPTIGKAAEKGLAFSKKRDIIPSLFPPAVMGFLSLFSGKCKGFSALFPEGKRICQNKNKGKEPPFHQYFTKKNNKL